MSSDVQRLAKSVTTALVGETEPVILEAIAVALEDLVMDGRHDPNGELVLAAQQLHSWAARSLHPRL